MDRLNFNVSDSHESWDIIEKVSTDAEYASKIPETTDGRLIAENDNDDDSDSVSIVTQKELELPPMCLTERIHCPVQEGCIEKLHWPKFVGFKCESYEIEDELDCVPLQYRKKMLQHQRKHKLNIFRDLLLIFTSIFILCIALSQIWDPKTDEFLEDSKNVSIILSNVYKLQKQNALLLTNLNELAAQHLNRCQITKEKPTSKQIKCNKLFEAPLSNNDSEIVTKCVDDKHDKFVNSEMLLNKTIDTDVKNEKAKNFSYEIHYVESFLDVEKFPKNEVVFCYVYYFLLMIFCVYSLKDSCVLLSTLLCFIVLYFIFYNFYYLLVFLYFIVFSVVLFLCIYVFLHASFYHFV